MTLETSRLDDQTAYAAVSRFRLDDLRPYIYRTHDGGRSWQKVVSGLPDDAPVNVVREDPVREGLLFCGTERGVFVSFDDGSHWQTLQLNLPATSMRDLTIHGDDLVVATHGRSFWILDDLTPLRELTSQVAREYRLQRALTAFLETDSSLDYIFIDCPPSLGLLTVNGLAASDDVIVPLQCEYYALEGLGQLLRNVALVKSNLNPALDVRGGITKE